MSKVSFGVEDIRWWIFSFFGCFVVWKIDKDLEGSWGIEGKSSVMKGEEEGYG